MVNIGEIEEAFKQVFQEEEGLVQSIETVYEMGEDETFYRLVISIHGLSVEDTMIIHTKFIFKTDLEKKIITENTFTYLYDINCIYHQKEFKNILDLRKKMEDIIESNDFGEDIKKLSDFIEAPAMFLNHYMRKEDITDYSVFEVKYEPKFKTTPCSETTFDFNININDNYEFEVSISKTDGEDGEGDTYKYQFKFMDEVITEESDILDNIHFVIGSSIAKILDDKLKGG
jgi:hypothetical protein